jgi:hypothetical protein
VNATPSPDPGQARPGPPPRESVDFSLMLGGPLYQLFRRAHLMGDAFQLVQRRVVVLLAVVWLPLVVLTALEGSLVDLTGGVSFLRDVEAQARFLLALPLLIAAELLVHRRLRPVLGQFVDLGIVPAEARPRFEAAVASTLRLRNSVFAEVLLIALVYSVGVLVVWRHYVALDTSSWYVVAGERRLSGAGIWYGYVSIPVFQFLLLRWYFRIFLWTRLLWRISRIDLLLIPTHPDRVGGLGFLAATSYAFVPLAMAHGALMAGFIGNRIFHLGAELQSFKAEVALEVLFVLGIVFVPMLVFAPRLAATKRIGLREYGTLARRYVQEFDAKWLRGGAPSDQPFIGSPDLQSLADLDNAYDIVRSMRTVPVTRDAVLRLALATTAPVVPLLLTLMSVEELIKRMVGIAF